MLELKRSASHEQQFTLSLVVHPMWQSKQHKTTIISEIMTILLIVWAGRALSNNELSGNVTKMGPEVHHFHPESHQFFSQREVM